MPMCLQEALAIAYPNLSDMDMKRCLFFLGSTDLLGGMALTSKNMNEMSKHNILWTLRSTEDPLAASGAAIMARRRHVLENGQTYGINPPTNAQAAQDAFAWFRFVVEVTREGLRREGGQALLAAAKGGNVGKVKLLCWAMVDLGAHDGVSVHAVVYVCVCGWSGRQV